LARRSYGPLIRRCVPGRKSAGQGCMCGLAVLTIFDSIPTPCSLHKTQSLTRTHMYTHADAHTLRAPTAGSATRTPQPRDMPSAISNLIRSPTPRAGSPCGFPPSRAPPPRSPRAPAPRFAPRCCCRAYFILFPDRSGPKTCVRRRQTRQTRRVAFTNGMCAGCGAESEFRVAARGGRRGAGVHMNYWPHTCTQQAQRG
jgi:hypothetical protein